MSKTDGWRYYNHALMPTTSPLDEVDISAIDDGSIWNTEEGKKALFAKWTTDFDCDEETNWWYWIADKAIDLQTTSAKKRYEIKKGLKNCTIERISPTDYAEKLYDVYLLAVARYKKYTNYVSKENFVLAMYAHNNQNREYWGIFTHRQANEQANEETNKRTGDRNLIGYGVCELKKEYINISVLKYVPEFLNLNSAYAITYTILNEYIANRGYKFVTNGERTIRHDTHVNEFNKMHFDFRKAYCKLHIVYRPGFDKIVNLLYPFRTLLKNLSFIGQINNVCALLLLERLNRENKDIVY